MGEFDRYLGSVLWAAIHLPNFNVLYRESMGCRMISDSRLIPYSQHERTIPTDRVNSSGVPDMPDLIVFEYIGEKLHMVLMWVA